MNARCAAGPRRGRSAYRPLLAAVLAVVGVAAGCSSPGGGPVASGPPGGSTPAAERTGATPTAVGPSPLPAGSAGLGAAPTPRPTPTGKPAPPARPGRITSWVYQLQDYPAGRLDAIARGPHQLAVIDLARDAHRDYFTAAEITALRRRGKKVLAYFEIGSVEDFRPEFRPLRAQAPDVLLNVWPDWPNERFVRYWDERWWQRAVRPRLDQALRAGFDGVYLDTPLAYEEIDLDLVPGWSRDRLARAMTALIVRISRYAKGRRPGFWVFPQNSPELRHHAGYTAAIDGIGMEELFYLATDSPCTADYCAENLAETRALRRAGKLVLAVDYATRPALVRAACGRYRREGFAGYAAVLDLDRVSAPCP